MADAAASDSTSWVPGSSYISVMNNIGLGAQLAQRAVGRAVMNGTGDPAAALVIAAWPYTLQGTPGAIWALALYVCMPAVHAIYHHQQQQQRRPAGRLSFSALRVASTCTTWMLMHTHTSHLYPCITSQWSTPLGSGTYTLSDSVDALDIPDILCRSHWWPLALHPVIHPARPRW
jgi:hypothetical protein